jgi:ribonuclease HIII
MDDPRLARLKRAIEAAGWAWRPGKPIPYGEQLLVADGSAEATLDFYPKRGRAVVGGSPSALRGALATMADRLATPAAPSAPASSAGPAAAPLGEAQIGMDESGKGDWFGPLVVAAVYLEPAQAAALRRAGVRDSKELDAEGLARAAAAIERAVPAERRLVTALDPEQYNRRYAALANINLLLAELYAATAAPVLKASGAVPIICDQFAQRADRLDRAFAAVGLPKPTQMHHAEAASLAVAAASVLATVRFGAELERLGALAGLGGALPRGASAVRALSAAARRIIAREGPAGLGRYAKLNFKPVQEILNAQR